MRTTIRMNAELARRAKKYAAEHDSTFTEVVEQAVTRLLEAPAKPKKRKRIVLPTFGDPSRKMTWEEYQNGIAQAQYEDDQKSLGLKRFP